MPNGFGRRWRHGLAAALAALALVACGGSGDGDGDGNTNVDAVQAPPTVAAGVSAGSSGDATGSAQAVVDSAAAAATTSGALDSFAVFFGGAFGAGQQFPQATRKRTLDRQTASCSEFLSSCSGSLSVDTNISDSATRIASGDFVDLQFVALAGSFDGMQIALNGGVRIEFLSAIDLDASSSGGFDFLMKIDNLTGSVNGAAFGPVNQSARVEVDAQGAVVFTADGRRFSGAGDVTFISTGNYTVGDTQVRTASWSNAGQYVDVDLQDWHVANGRPMVGSAATVTAGNGSIAVRVTSSSAASVVHAVSISAGGSVSAWAVTATYPAGGGAPTYAAVRG